MRYRHSIAIVIAVLGSIVTGTFSAIAQEATPVSLPVTCDGPQRTADELLDLWFDGTSGLQGTPESDEAFDGIVIPIGEPADDATAAAIEATVAAVFACFNTGDALRAFALFTDDLAMQFGPEPGTSREEAEAFLTAAPEPAAPDELSEIVAVTNVMLLDDGRVGAFVIDQTGGELATAYAIFEQVDGRWLVDQVIDFSGEGEDEE